MTGSKERAGDERRAARGIAESLCRASDAIVTLYGNNTEI